MRYITHNGTIKILAGKYNLTLPADRPFAYLEEISGERCAELFYLSGANPMHGRDDTLSMGSWEIHEDATSIELSLRVESSVWESKTIRFCCRPDRIYYSYSVEGQGQLAEVNYFGGYYSGQIRWGSGFFWSGQKFKQAFNPEPNSEEINYFNPSEGSVIDLMGVPLPGKNHWFFTPPPMCYAFQAKNGWTGLGIQAGAGEHQFTEFNYHARRGAFHLSLSYEGHTAVDGVYELPTVAILFGVDEFDVLEQHVQSANAELKREPRETTVKPAWWFEPIFCGWGGQCGAASLVKGKAPDFSKQELYEQFLAELDRNGINPGMVVLDDKWQSTYGENRPDASKWPDLAGFVQKQHALGRKVLLWIKAWDPEGIPAEECVTNARGTVVSVDPSNPAFEARLRRLVREMLSSAGCDADGFKIDFSARVPSGPGLKAHGELWGLELMHCYLEIIYSEAKLVKPDALVMTHTPHPYLADVLDMVRLNDINIGTNINAAMKLRARVAAIACPDAVIDTDNWPQTNRESWRGYVKLQPNLGVPSLYFVNAIDSTQEPLTAEDYARIRDAWDRHRLMVLARNATVNPPERIP